MTLDRYIRSLLKEGVEPITIMADTNEAGENTGMIEVFSQADQFRKFYWDGYYYRGL